MMRGEDKKSQQPQYLRSMSTKTMARLASSAITLWANSSAQMHPSAPYYVYSVTIYQGISSDMSCKTGGDIQAVYNTQKEEKR